MRNDTIGGSKPLNGDIKMKKKGEGEGRATNLRKLTHVENKMKLCLVWPGLELALCVHEIQNQIGFSLLL